MAVNKTKSSAQSNQYKYSKVTLFEIDKFVTEIPRR